MSAKRIEYIDALRGFAMLLVVFTHVEGAGFFEYSYGTFTGALFSSFYMPLFFFISGFVGYKSCDWTTQWFKDSVNNKLRTLLVPTFFFGLIYTYCYCGNDFGTFIINPAKLGYWFTIALLEMFIVYYAVNYIVFNTKKTNQNRIWIITLLCLAVIFYGCKLPIKQIPILRFIGDVTSMHYTFEYFQFFVFGLLASKYRDQFNRYLDNGYISGGLLIIFSILFYAKFKYIDIYLTCNVDKWLILSTLIGDFCGYAGIAVVYVTFRKYRKSFTSISKWGSFWQYIGRNTLAIYMLHYFFIPCLPQVGAFLRMDLNVVLELLLGFLFSIAIIACCLVISNVIRISNRLGYYLLGEKLKS